ncbi:unnamed protein product, partial [marine sediment metagenome]
YSDSDNTVVLNNCRFAGSLGGAVYCAPNCVLNVDDCSFKDNTDTDDGGAIFAGSGSYVKVADSTFVGNSAYSGGGALNCKTNANFKNCLFRENESGGNGGAIDAYYDTGNPEVRLILNLSFESCYFTGNKATEGLDGWGGGVYFKDFNATFTDCSFVDNVARSGGGLFLTSGTVTLSGGIISSNRSVGGDDHDIGGGLACVDTHATIENCTIKDNVARGVNGAGGAINFYGGYVKHQVRNCLITGNSA